MSSDATTPARSAMQLHDALLARAASLRLDPRRLTVSPVLNVGGFVNQSFHATDGRTRLHVKLADDPEQVAKLRRWRSVHALLEQRHRAPAMLHWLTLPEAGLEGPVLAFVAGSAPARLTPSLFAAMTPRLRRLHADRELAARLRGEDGEAPCGETFRRVYLERFTADLALIEQSPPPFVAPTTLAWARAEAAALDARVRASAAFDEPADAAIHSDLWLNNLIVGDDAEPWILDWDDLRLGDPALDWAMLLGPTRAALPQDGPMELASEPAPELPLELDAPPFRERFALYARAALLDWIIDPLADWTDADAMPEHTATLREENRRIHLAALALYRERHPSRG